MAWRGLTVAAVAAAGAGGIAAYVHWDQEARRKRMRRNVEREIAAERLARQAAAAVAPCEGDICALAVKRVRPDGAGGGSGGASTGAASMAQP